MNDNWYKEGGWYKPLYPAEEPEKPEVKEVGSDGKKKRRNRWIYLSILLLVLGISMIVTAHLLPDVDKSSEDSYDVTGEMPKDFHDYLDNFYTGTTGTPVKVNLPQAAERGSLTLKVASSSGNELSLGELYEKCTPSVVYIKAQEKGSIVYSWGSGIVLSSDGYILTNTHVIADCDVAEVGLSDGSAHEALLIGADSVSDLAILKIDAEGLTPAVFCRDASVGDEVAAIGNPLGESYRLTMTNGIVSAINRSVNHNGTTMNLLQTNAAINEGNSGGPLFNSCGQVIGITNMKVVSGESGVEGIGFAIPTSTVEDIVSALMAKGEVLGRSTIGITVGAIPDSAAEHYKIPAGLYVCDVLKNSDAYKQGVRAGDILTEVNGEPVAMTEDLAAVKNSISIGDTMHFKVWRDGKVLEFDVKLMDATDIYG